MDTLQTILDSGVIAIIRSDSDTGLLQTARALSAGGVRALEVTMTTPGALEAIRSIAAQAQGQFIVGAGTVLDAEAARQAISAGAQFLVSPGTDLGVIQTAKRLGKVVLPGALTPTEVITAWNAGADLVKIFPASLGGPDYIKALRAPLPRVRLVPVGGVEVANAAAYIRAGAAAVAMGGSLVNTQLIAAGAWDQITQTARAALQAVASARSSSR
jgi:2-dehydro-3-deoxyphosphogluconate aldolase/(4S)-4-hydroxy-2-oxoglutarate aldolase